MSRDIESTKKYGLRRLFNKVLQAIAKSSLLSGYMRARVQKLRGVNFDDSSKVFLGEDVIIDAISPENVTIRNGVEIAAGAKIVTHFPDTRKLSENKDYHYRFYKGKVVIEEDVFIGFNCVIAKPVTIGRGSVLGANTVITKDVPPESIIVLPESINLKKV
ncbi:acyltransferase [Flavobacteriales bacterium]|jgi:acetyltransferase-like isoleucine patch superfamily enzyme|nr:acyltransferase [Flavobacteriales bacterium]